MNKKVIILLSDGLDSPVASYQMMKKGFMPVFVTFITTNQYATQMEKKVLTIVHQLIKDFTLPAKLYFIPHNNNLTQIISTCPRKLTCILCKRLMYRIALALGSREGTNIIITGDILGEQASQTLSNLRAYSDLFKGSIKLSPLIGLNKLDIIHRNKDIGVYDIASQKLQSCLNYPQYPETHAKLKEVEDAEKKLDLKRIISKSLETSKKIEIQ
ncbi:MAG: hypothetical protein BAJALOKI1v1_280025 [Promethearchaeota archaeon]|nr:MAG: hypothetical protein BAJALOKI1v1_280025 [Candidatus Lokiarchaeota archaeon]